MGEDHPVPIPPFLADLRKLVGTRPLWLASAHGVVVSAAGDILLSLRSDDQEWSLPGGILEPGEEPADAVVRECQEEAGVLVAPERLTLVDVSPTFSYPSGDQCQYIDIVFLCRLVKGTAVVNDEESDCVQWFQRGNLPPLSEYIRRQIGLSLAGGGPATFVVHGQDRPLSKP